MRFFIVHDGQRRGPFTLEQLAEQRVERNTLVWQQGLPDWTRADEVPALAELIAAVPPPVPRRAPPPPPVGDAELAAAWTRYRPGSFKSLYFWFVTLLSASLVLAALGAVLVIIAGNIRTQRQDRWDQFGRIMERGGFDPEARDRRTMMEIGGGIGLIAGGVALISALVLFYVLLYKAWNQIQDGRARTTAGMAVGFLFIPLFHFYWLFVAIYGLAADLHNYVLRRGLLPRLGPFPVSPGLALACCILMIANAIPIVGFFSVLPSLVVLTILLGQIRWVSAEIAAYRLQQWSPEAEPVPVAVPRPAPPPVPLPDEAHSEQVTRRDGGPPAR